MKPAEWLPRIRQGLAALLAGVLARLVAGLDRLRALPGRLRELRASLAGLDRATVKAWALARATHFRDRLRARLKGLPGQIWQQFGAHRLRSALATLLLAALLLAGIRLVPAVYGRYALVHAAGIAARQSLLKGQDRVVYELRHRAFDLGLTEAALDPDAFQLETGLSDDGPTCTVSYDFIHLVRFYGPAQLRLRYRARITRVQLDPVPNAPSTETEPEGRR